MHTMFSFVSRLCVVALFMLTVPAHAQEAATEATAAEAAAPAYDAALAAEATSFAPEKIVGKAVPWQLDFQDAHSPVMEQFRWFHDLYVLPIITVITLFVMALLIYVCIRFSRKNNPVPQTFTHNAKIEVIWTVIPILILVAIVIPSLRVHYQYSDNETIINNPDMTLKVTGHQWYWSYEYPDQGISFDSNMKKDADLLPGEPRLLAVDNPIVVPVNKVVRVQVTSADVIHAFALPAFGVKQDTVPGRLNETWFKATKEGIYYGQCSELCGKFHGFMPIEVHVVSQEMFDAWVGKAKEEFASNAPFSNHSRQFAAK